ncbi:MAG: hypothetical protein ACFFHV_15075 [Promethearchaeota archaeon]
MDLLTLLLIILTIALIAAVINFIIGMVVMLRMISLKGLTKKKKPAIILNTIWSIIVFLFSFNPWLYIIAFIINLIIGLIALSFDEFYGIKRFGRRIKILFAVLIIQFVIVIITYIIIVFIIFAYLLG